MPLLFPLPPPADEEEEEEKKPKTKKVTENVAEWKALNDNQVRGWLAAACLPCSSGTSLPFVPCGCVAVGSAPLWQGCLRQPRQARSYDLKRAPTHLPLVHHPTFPLPCPLTHSNAWHFTWHLACSFTAVPPSNPAGPVAAPPGQRQRRGVRKVLQGAQQGTRSHWLQFPTAWLQPSPALGLIGLRNKWVESRRACPLTSPQSPCARLLPHIVFSLSHTYTHPWMLPPATRNTFTHTGALPAAPPQHTHTYHLPLSPTSSLLSLIHATPPASPPQKDWEIPVAHTHFKAEGDVEFKAVLFVPGTAAPGASPPRLRPLAASGPQLLLPLQLIPWARLMRQCLTRGLTGTPTPRSAHPCTLHCTTHPLHQ
jgi:hypothetical protein